MKHLAIIPARSGSKGLPDKNIRPLMGKPLLAYSIEAANTSGLFEDVMVSTDSEQYAQIARSCGASVPFLRSPETSSDTAGSWDAVKEVLARYKALGKTFDTVCLLQPTSPLRTAQDILGAYALFEEKNALSVVSVCEMEHSPLWSNILPPDHSLNGFLNPSSRGRRQDLATFYRLNGALYIVKTEELMKSTDLYKEGSFAYIMPMERSVDIDILRDFDYAEFLLTH